MQSNVDANSKATLNEPVHIQIDHFIHGCCCCELLVPLRSRDLELIGAPRRQSPPESLRGADGGNCG